jgi:NAD(P)H-hydrate epimerase
MLFCSPNELTGDAATNCRIVQKCDIPMFIPPESLDDAALRRELANADCFVDALFGSGLKGPVRPPYDRVIDAINASSVRVFAVDIPSGLDSDTGNPLGSTIRASHTATIVAAKKGFEQPGSREWTGELHIIDIGLPRALRPE